MPASRVAIAISGPIVGLQHETSLLHDDWREGLRAKRLGVKPLHLNRTTPAYGVAASGKTNKSIITIANDVGYSNPSHFAQLFRKETGLSPTDYRRER